MKYRVLTDFLLIQKAPFTGLFVDFGGVLCCVFHHFLSHFIKCFPTYVGNSGKYSVFFFAFDDARHKVFIFSSTNNVYMVYVIISFIVNGTIQAC